MFLYFLRFTLVTQVRSKEILSNKGFLFFFLFVAEKNLSKGHFLKLDTRINN